MSLLRGLHCSARCAMAAGVMITLGCSVEQPLSTLDPAGPGASSVATLWWVMFWGSMAITAGMVVLTLAVVLRPRGRASRRATLGWIVGGGLVFPGAVLTALMLYGMGPGRPSGPEPDPQARFDVEVVAHQWWWEVIYPQADGSALYDANEIHVPAGRPVHVTLRSADVIHSFWVPRLGGKVDAIPGQVNHLVLRADAPGRYRGQCSEFCGAQHARMGFHVEAHPEQALDERLARLPRRSRELAARGDAPGAAEFARYCAACHSVDAGARPPQPGPNLAGLTDRHRLGGGWLDNDAGNRREWLTSHHLMKPGNRMPSFEHFDAAALDRIAAFLELEE